MNELNGKHILAVHRSNEGDGLVKAIMKELRRIQPDSVGIELPSNNRDLISQGYVIPVFGEVAQRLDRSLVPYLGLEEPGIRERTAALEVLRDEDNRRSSTILNEKSIAFILTMNGWLGYSSSELASLSPDHEKMHELQRIKEVTQELLGQNQTLDAVRSYLAHTKERLLAIKGKVDRFHPDCLIVSNYIASQLKGILPEYKVTEVYPAHGDSLTVSGWVKVAAASISLGLGIGLLYDSLNPREISKPSGTDHRANPQMASFADDSGSPRRSTFHVSKSPDYDSSDYTSIMHAAEQADKDYTLKEKSGFLDIFRQHDMLQEIIGIYQVALNFATKAGNLDNQIECHEKIAEWNLNFSRSMYPLLRPTLGFTDKAMAHYEQALRLCISQASSVAATDPQSAGAYLMRVNKLGKQLEGVREEKKRDRETVTVMIRDRDNLFGF